MVESVWTDEPKYPYASKMKSAPGLARWRAADNKQSARLALPEPGCPRVITHLEAASINHDTFAFGVLLFAALSPPGLALNHGHGGPRAARSPFASGT